MTEGKATILVVDDEEQVRKLLRRILEEAGYDVDQEALDLVAESEPALVVLDIKMPGKSGLEVLEELKANHPDTAVIMATAVGDVNIAVDAMREGALDYLTKPFNVNELVISVARALERRRLILENRNYQLSLDRQLTALNNLFQTHLRLREDVEEVYNRLAVNLAKLSEEIQTVAKEAEAERKRIQIPPAERTWENTAGPSA